MTLIISGFPGIGKTTLFEKYGAGVVSDSDSSKFPKDDFPANYISHIKELISNNKEIVLVSSHEVVRDALLKEGIEFVLVYPDVSLKEEYITRYKNRGSSDTFINLLSEKWDSWIKECEELEGVRKYKLLSTSDNLTSCISDLK